VSAAISVSPWATWAESLSLCVRKDTAYPLRNLVVKLLDHKPTDVGELAALGVAARRLLTFALDSPFHDPWFVVSTANAVCATYTSDARDSAQLLRRLFTVDRLATNGWQEIPRIAEAVVGLSATDPDIVHDFYVAVFDHVETSSNSTLLVPSAVLPMMSTRRQDYEGGLYLLGRDFPRFLEIAPGHATSALLAILARDRARDAVGTPAASAVASFNVHGVEARLEVEPMRMWDHSSYHARDEPLQMLDALDARLAALVKPASSDATGSISAGRSRAALEEILARIIFENDLPIVWRHVFEFGSTHAAAVTSLLAPLAWATPLLLDPRTTGAATDFVGAVYPFLSRGEREHVEATIVGLSGAGASQTAEQIDIQARLLRSIPTGLLITQAARSLKEHLGNRATAARRPVSTPIGVRHLRMGGIPSAEYASIALDSDTAAAPTDELVMWARAAQDFGNANGVPSVDESHAILPTLRQLRRALNEPAGLSNRSRLDAQLALASASARIARGALDCHGELGQFILNELVVASRTDPPEDSHENLWNDEGMFAITTRTVAAAGIVDLAHWPTCATAIVLETIRRLAMSEASAVRTQVFRHLSSLAATDRALMWELLDWAVREETETGVLHAVVVTLSACRNVDAARVAGLAAAVADRVKAKGERQNVLNDCATVFADLAFRLDEPTSGARLDQIVDDPSSHAGEAADIVNHFRNWLVLGDPAQTDAKMNAARQRVIDFMARTAARSTSQLNGLLNVDPTATPQPADAIAAQVKRLASVLDALASSLFFVASAVAKAQDTAESPDGRTNSLLIKRLYREGASILDSLANVGLAHVAHHVLEALELMVPTDPTGIFLLIARVVRAAKLTNYQYDALAQGIVIRLVERYLAEYAELLANNDACRTAVLDVLDIFVSAGWPQAVQLTYRLSDAYR
jgi:hypothetical protein